MERYLKRLKFDLEWLMKSPGKWHCGIENLKVRYTEVPAMLLLMLVCFLGMDVPKDYAGDTLDVARRTHEEE